MIQLTKLNGERVIINCKQIEYIEFIPESKIVMMNGKFHLVAEDEDTIIEKTIRYYQMAGSGILNSNNRQHSPKLEDKSEQ